MEEKNKNNLVIGIEGYVGAGKTSICRELLNIIPKSILLNGGNLYRAIMYILIKNGKNINELKKNLNHIDIKKVMDMLKIEIKIENKETVFYCNGEKIQEEDLQSRLSSMAVSQVGGIADNSKLFEFARELINALRKDYNVIVSGRGLMDIYPGLDYHFFIVADIEERAKRKREQYNNDISIEEIKRHIEQRDELQRKSGFYKISDNTTIIDVTDCCSVEESTNKVFNEINLVRECNFSN